MKKGAVVISIVAVFAILSLSIAAVPLYKDQEANLSFFDLDPIIDAAIEQDVIEALEGNTVAATTEEISEEQNEEPVVIGTSSSVQLSNDQNEHNGGYVIYDKTGTSPNEEWTITGYSGNITSLELGSYADGKYVKIAEGAFRNCKTLTSVNLLNCTGLTTIDMAAFYGCTALEEVSLPSSVTTIGGYAFTNTPWLTSKRNNVQDTTKLVIVNNILIDGNKAVGTNGKVEIPSTVVKIAPYAFSYNYTMTSLSFKSRTSTIDIPYRCFALCSKLKTIKLNGVGNIGAYAFTTCTALEEIVDFDNNLGTIGNAAFSGCTKLATFDFSGVGGADNVVIGDQAFMDCTAITSVKFPQKISTIGTAAFMGCESLRSITFNSATTSVTLNQAAFKDCTKLDTLTKDSGTTLSVTGTGGTLANAFYNTKIVI